MENNHNQNTEVSAPLVEAAFNQDMNAVQALLSAGHDVNEQDGYLSTALQWAANFGNAPMVTLLLEYGADVTLCDAGGDNAAFLAMDNGHAEVLGLLAAQVAARSAATE